MPDLFTILDCYFVRYLMHAAPAHMISCLPLLLLPRILTPWALPHISLSLSLYIYIYIYIYILPSVQDALDALAVEMNATDKELDSICHRLKR